LSFVVVVDVARLLVRVSLRVEILGTPDFRVGVGVPGLETQPIVFRLSQANEKIV
jgi:hypothetical protein